MKKLKIGDLEKIRDKIQNTTNLRKSKARGRITVHMGTCGLAAGARKIMSALLEESKRKKVTDIIITTSGCAGLCSREPMVTVELSGSPPVKYVDMTEEKIRKIITEHIIEGKIIKKYAIALGSERTF
jgi:NADP-reducing hydrogenase subunit HndB